MIYLFHDRHDTLRPTRAYEQRDKLVTLQWTGVGYVLMKWLSLNSPGDNSRTVAKVRQVSLACMQRRR